MTASEHNEALEVKATLRLVISVLKESQEHHEFCGWGDRYERECALNSGLDEKIDEAIKRGEKCL